MQASGGENDLPVQWRPVANATGQRVLVAGCEPALVRYFCAAWRFARIPAWRASGNAPQGNGSTGEAHMIRRCDENDFEMIWQIINDGAQAYKSVIPEDRYKEPYMSRNELRHEMRDGVEFWGFEEYGALDGVMGIQPVKDVTLIRHAYVRAQRQRTGIGARLLAHLHSLASGPVLIGTWADASWAIQFYDKYGFRVVGPEQKNALLRRYWNVPDAQAAASVVLVEHDAISKSKRKTWPADGDTEYRV